jgi:hypothetical protein
MMPKGGRAREVYEAVTDECRRLGVQFLDPVKGGKHFKMPILVDGHRHSITLAISPSDPQAATIKRQDLRRLVRSIRGGQ